MAKVTVLVEGYARQKEGYFEASPTVVLIEDNGKKIIVDPGCNEKLLLDALKAHSLSPQDIDFVFLTHYHMDHLLNIRLFPGKDIIDGDTIWRGDREYSYSKKLPGTDIEVIQTPGHSKNHASLLVKTDEGVVGVAADVFWWMDGKQKTDLKSLLEIDDAFMENGKQLLASRKLLLMKADYIIPGHGVMFKVPKK